MTIASAIALGIFAVVVALCGVDVWLDLSGREMITQAIREDNSATGWIIAGVWLTFTFHLFFLPPALRLFHRLIGN